MSSIKAIMVVKQSAVKEIIEELSDVLSEQPGLVIKIEKDQVFNSMFDLDTESIDVDISDEIFLDIALRAHKRNITFNQMVTEILIEQIEKDEKTKFGNITPKAETSFVPNDNLHNLVNSLLAKT